MKKLNKVLLVVTVFLIVSLSSVAYDRLGLFYLLEAGVESYDNVLQIMTEQEFRELVRLYFETSKTADVVEATAAQGSLIGSLEVSVGKCSDGTAYSSCSSTQPLYCSYGVLVNNCQACGCPPANDCVDGVSCVPRFCSDGTLDRTCSETKPKFCRNNVLIDNCDTCGCPGSVTCGGDGACVFPKITGITSPVPAQGPESGGTSITISGSGFIPNPLPVVKIGGVTATVSSATGTAITATTPAHVYGAVDVVVVNADGGTGTLVGGFTYGYPPTIASVAPSSGLGGTVVTISGSNFVSGAGVTFGGVASASVTFVSSAELTAVVPAHALGAVDVVVVNANGGTGTLSGGFTYITIPAPTITSISPSSGDLGGGTTVVITGTNFYGNPLSSVTFGGVAATSVGFDSSSQLSVVTPAHAIGAVAVTVTNPGGGSATSTPTDRVFVTSTDYTGNLGGLSGGDAKCQERADAAGLGGRWKAWLSTEDVYAVERIPWYTTYVRLDGVIIANSVKDLIDGSIDNSLNLNEYGEVEDASVWTGSDRGGIRDDSSRCREWRDTEAWATTGCSQSTDARWTECYDTERYETSCRNPRNLYCFEQFLSGGFTYAETCSDGTVYNHCSATKPLYCDDGSLVNDCNTCGCQEGYECRSNGECTPNKCVTLVNNGPPADKVDVVYVGNGYLGDSQLRLFRDAVTTFKNTLLSYSPFKENSGRFNFYRVDNTENLDCYLVDGIGGRCVVCDPAKVEQAVSDCPHDQVGILLNSEGWYGCAQGFHAHSSSSYPVIGVHEFGHTFGKLRDEYVDIPFYGHAPEFVDPDFPGPNCDASSSCSRWTDLKGVGGVACFAGCNYPEWYRPVESNTMMLDTDGPFNPVGIRQLLTKLGAYK